MCRDVKNFRHFKFLPMSKYFFICLILLLVLKNNTSGQQQTLSGTYFGMADSLIKTGKYTEAIGMYKLFLDVEQNLSDPDLDKMSESLNNTGVCHFVLRNYHKALSSFNKALDIDIKLDNKKNIATCLNNIGLIYKILGNYDIAIENYLEALKIVNELGDQENIAISMNNIGSIYADWGKFDKAIEYYEQSLRIKEALSDTAGVSKTLNNIGLLYNSWKKYSKAIANFNEALQINKDGGNTGLTAKILNNTGLAFYNLGNIDTALYYYQKALDIDIKLGNKDQIATRYNNIGLIYLKMKDYPQADFYLNLSLKMYSELGLRADISIVLSNLADLFFETGNYNQALDFLQQSTKISEEINLRNQTKKNYLEFSEIYAATGNFPKSLSYYKKYSTIKDSIFTDEIHKQITDFEIKYETERKDKEIKLLKQHETIQNLALRKQKIIRNSFLIGFILSMLLIIVIFRNLLLKRKHNKVIEYEKAKSDKLLLNILPAKVANDLKEKGITKPKLFENVTVFISDFVGFTDLSSILDPEFLIDELNDIFTTFDNIFEKNSCERIKTIGDAYLAVCGLPESNPQHAENIAKSAIQILDYMKNRNNQNDVIWEIRIGIHSGKVVAGVVGIKKYIYDVFGDTINIASRMESHSEPMKINVSQHSYNKLKDKFEFTKRGKIETKGKGLINMYYLVSMLK